MSIKQNRLNAKALSLLLAVTYMVSYITRINFGAVISEMVTATGLTKAQLSPALTGSFITYGIGQVISGALGDKASPKRLVSAGLCTTVLMNLLVPVFPSPYIKCLLWCINGFAQSLMWPPIVKIMTGLLSSEEYKKASTVVSFGSSFGTIAVYLFSPVLISLFGWRSVFIASAICGIAMLIAWNLILPNISFRSDSVPEVTENSKNKGGSFFGILIMAIMLAIILQGMLRDGVTTWMPTYIAETYKLGNAVSILTGVILPVFSLLCIQAASRLYIKRFKNPLQCSAVFFGSGAVASLLLYLVTGKSAVMSVIFSALLTGCMHGVNFILICMIPAFYKDGGRVSTVSGILNSCTYIGSALSTYGISVLSDKIGWGATLIIWFAIALAGTVVCTLCIKPWKKEKM